MNLSGIQNTGNNPNIENSKENKHLEKEVQLDEFKASIFNSWGDSRVANDKKTVLKSDTQIEQKFQANDINGIKGLNTLEKENAIKSVNAYIQSAYSDSISGNEEQTERKAKIDQGVQDFNAMNEDQKLATIKQEIADIIQDNKDVSFVGDGNIKIGDEVIDLKKMGLSDASIKVIESEIQKHQAEKAQPKNDE